MFDRSILGLDIGSHSVKIALLRSGLRDASFEGFDELLLPRGAASEEIEATIQLWAQQRGFPLEYVVTALPADRITQRHLRFPFSGAKRVNQAIEFEIAEDLPVPLDEMIIASEQVLSRPEQTDALVLVAPHTEVRMLLDSMQRMEFEPQIIEAGGAALANLSGYLGLADVSRIILDIGHCKTNVVLLVDGKPVILRRIGLAGEQLTEAIAADHHLSFEQAESYKHTHGLFETGGNKPVSQRVRFLLEQLISETQRSIQAVIGDPLDAIAPTEMLLVGGTSRAKGLASYFEEHASIRCRVLTAEDANRSDAPLSEAGPALYAQAAALALRGSNTERVTQVDFRQDELAYTPDISGMRGQLQLCVALFALFLALWTGSAIARKMANGQRVEQLRADVASIYQQTFPDAPPVDDPLPVMETKARDMNELANHLGVMNLGLSVLDVLREISNRTPEELDISIDDLRIERRNIVARGRSNDFVSADQFKAELAKFPAFKQVLITDVKTDTRRGGKTFVLNIRLEDDS
ncbi:MAG: pilus assembly protein PilM [bacterium]|nr:pilus assembly protein PilM [bacterium]